VKFADILSEEEFVPDYDELSDDDDLPKQDIETKTDDDLVARLSLLEDQLKKEKVQHKEETRKLGELEERLDDKDEEIQNLNSMIVTLDEYENLPKYGTRSSYALDGFDDLCSSTDSQTRALQEKLYDNNNMTDDKPTEKRTPDRDSPSPRIKN
jgi:vacuolar-type H+-ATPase subunit I/STV1